jgi:hypothetical protein
MALLDDEELLKSTISATPRNQILGLLSDFIAQGYDPRRTQQMQGISKFLMAPEISQTLDRLSYDPSGRSLFTGAGGLGGTTRMRPEALDAALAVAPMAGPAARLAGRGVMATKGLPVGASIKNIGKTDLITGLPLNADGTVTLFHHTNKTAAEQITKSGRLRSAGEPSVYLTTEKTTNTGYGDVAVPVRVKPSLLNLDDEFPSGRMDFSIDTGKPKGSVPVTVEKQSPQAPQQAALDLAQQRAALPVEQGGLGLLGSNTAEQRAKAMGFDLETFHGTDSPSIASLDPKRTKIIEGVFSSTNPASASTYAFGAADKGRAGIESSPNVMPLLLNSAAHQRMLSSFNKDSIDSFRKSGQSGVYRPESEVAVTFNPDDIRSRFAAFDPFRRSAAVAATMGAAAPDLLAAQQDEEMRKLQQLGLLGMVAP